MNYNTSRPLKFDTIKDLVFKIPVIMQKTLRVHTRKKI